MSKSRRNRQERRKRAKQNRKVTLTRAIARILYHIQENTPEGFSKVFVEQRKQRIKFTKGQNGNPTEIETIDQQMYVFTKKITEQRLANLGETIMMRVEQYHELERSIPVMPGQQAVQFRQQMEQLLPHLCRDWWEYSEIFRAASGGASIPFGQDIWLNDHCARIVPAAS